MNFVEKIINAIDVEYDYKKQEIDELKSIPLDERLLKGDTITNLKATFYNAFEGGGFSDTDELIFKKVVLKCVRNNSKFKIGSPVILSGNGCSFELEVMKDSEYEIELYKDYDYYSVRPSLHYSQNWTLNPAPVDIRHIVKGSTDIMLQKQSISFKLENLFNGISLPSYHNVDDILSKKLVSNSNLNEKQKEAFYRCIGTDNYYLVQGPPGTGKTFVLAYIAHYLKSMGKKVLITANTHTAINNALDRIINLFGADGNVLKVSKKNQSSDRGIVPVYPDFRKSPFDNTTKGLIVGASCYAPYTNKLKHMEWDYVIFDEAGQISIALAIAAMVKADKYIFIGDHKQLPPIIPETQKDPIFQKSIFEHLFNYSEGTLLNTTYRMNNEIAEFPSKQFYNQQLYSDVSVANKRLDIINHFQHYQSILDIESPAVLVCHSSEEDYPRSPFEANLICKILKAYIEKGVSVENIAIITPVRAQVREIKNQVGSDEFLKSYINSLFIDTVEQIQGQERDVVIFSLSVSNPIKAKQRVEFFLNPNRLNVAITRSRLKRIVIGHKSLFYLTSYKPAYKRLIKNFKDFYDSSKIIEI